MSIGSLRARRLAAASLLLVLAACDGKKSPTPSKPNSVTTTPTATAKPTPTAKPVAPPSGPEMVKLPGGALQMGANTPDADPNEKPVHREDVRPFWIDRTEVTVAAYRACVDAGRCTPAGTGQLCNSTVVAREHDPINCVDWDQAAAYCAYAGKRLPSEKEWEFAARGVEGRLYPWGGAAPAKQGCWKRWDSAEGTCAVGSFPAGATPNGVLDLAGNVAEWTSSTYCPYGSDRCATHDRVVRGGGWGRYGDHEMRGTAREKVSAKKHDPVIGLRCAKDG